MVDRRGIAKALAKVRPHGLQHFGKYRSGRVVIEIDAASHRATIVLVADANRREFERKTGAQSAEFRALRSQVFEAWFRPRMPEDSVSLGHLRRAFPERELHFRVLIRRHGHGLVPHDRFGKFRTLHAHLGCKVIDLAFADNPPTFVPGGTCVSSKLPS